MSGNIIFVARNFTKVYGLRLNHFADSDWPQLRGLAILALSGALKFFAVLNVWGEDFMVFWREHDELFNRFPEKFKNPVPFIFLSYCQRVCFSIFECLELRKLNNNCQGPIPRPSRGPCAMAQWHIGQSEPAILYCLYRLHGSSEMLPKLM